MRNLQFLGAGVLFGFVLLKSEIASWYRIQEMFRFDSFHMYGIIATAILTASLGLMLIRKFEGKNRNGQLIETSPKDKSLWRYLLGGSIFGLGWALTGACPGPMYALIGGGNYIFLLILLSAIAGTLLYGMLRKRLPH